MTRQLMCRVRRVSPQWSDGAVSQPPASTKMIGSLPMKLKTPRAISAVAVALATAAALTACGTSSPAEPGNALEASSQKADALYEGRELTESFFDKPDLVLTDTTGKPFDLRKETAGRAVLLFFGYTHCPDVCPTTMGDIAVALKAQPKDVRQKTDVVFVSTDPERDTPKALGTWLAAFDADFIGLTGDLAKVKAAAQPLGVMVEDPETQHDGTVMSSHGGQLLGFFPTDDKAHLVYLSGTPVESFSHDLPLLARGKQTPA